VIIGRKGNVEIKGNLEIQEGASVDVQGQVLIHEHIKQKEGKPERIENNDKKKK
jgi:hypothetical protein